MDRQTDAEREEEEDKDQATERARQSERERERGVASGFVRTVRLTSFASPVHCPPRQILCSFSPGSSSAGRVSKKVNDNVSGVLS